MAGEQARVSTPTPAEPERLSVAKEYRLLMIQFRLKGYSNEEVAEALGMQRRTYDMRLRCCNSSRTEALLALQALAVRWGIIESFELPPPPPPSKRNEVGFRHKYRREIRTLVHRYGNEVLVRVDQAKAARS